jgi:uncharacterized protein with LGFP repeats
MSDPCASIVAKIADNDGEVKSLQSQISHGGPKEGVVGLISKLQADTVKARGDLAACRLKIIEAEHAKVGGDSGPLGTRTTGAEQCDDGVGWFADFQHGAIFWTPATGAHAVWGKFFTKWKKLDKQNGPLGYPNQDKTTTTGGDYINFESGVILLKTGADEAFEVHGAIRGCYIPLDSEKGFLGFPSTDETVAPDHVGRFNRFEHGAILWKPTIGAHEVHGPTRVLWDQLHAEAGRLGYPIANATPIAHGSKDTFSDFENGVILTRANGESTQMTPLITKSRAEILDLIRSQISGVLKSADSRLYVEEEAKIDKVTDYSLATNGVVRNRMYGVAVTLGITVAGTNDPDIGLTLDIELRLDHAKKRIEAIPRDFIAHISVQFPTSLGKSASDIAAELKPKLDAIAGVPLPVMDVPDSVIVVKVMTDGSVQAFVAL